MVVNVAVPLAVDDDLDPRRARERDEHGVERGDAGRDPRGRLHRRAQRRRRHHLAVPRRRRAARRVDLEPRRVEVDPHLDRRLLCRAPPLGAARRRRRRRRRRGPPPARHPWSAAPPPLPSASRAARKARANDLKHDSRMWCALSPRTRRSDRSAPSAAASASQNAGVSAVRKRPIHLRPVAASPANRPYGSRRTAHAPRRSAGGRRSITASANASSSGQQKMAAAAAAGGGGGGDLVDHAAQREAERGAARDEDVAVVRPARHARRVVAARREPRAAADAAPQRDAELAVRRELVAHVVEEADARANFRRRREVEHARLGDDGAGGGGGHGGGGRRHRDLVGRGRAAPCPPAHRRRRAHPRRR